MKQIRLRKSMAIPVLVVVLFSALNLFDFYSQLELGLYDLFLKLSKGPEEDKRIRLVNIDDLSIAQVGMFPWSRAIMADGLILMREMGAAYAVFDIEYTEKSPMGLNSDFLNQDIPKILDQEFLGINENMTGLFQALAEGYLTLEEAGAYVEELGYLNSESKQRLQAYINQIARDNDVYFGQAARFFGKTVFTVNMLKNAETEYDAELKQWVAHNLGLKIPYKPDAAWDKKADIRPPVGPIITQSDMVGFTNVVVDPDGIRRRVFPVSEHNGTWYPQLSFSAVYDLYGRPEMELKKGELLLKNAELPNGRIQDIRIPLDNEGRMLINWPRKKFEESFLPQIPYYRLVQHNLMEQILVGNVENLEQNNFLQFHNSPVKLMDLYSNAKDLREAILAGEPTDLIEDYRQARELFFSETARALEGTARDKMLAAFDRAIANPDLAEEDRIRYQDARNQAVQAFSESEAAISNLQTRREELKNLLDGRICYIGWTGTATHDIGINPFDENYDNVGTHASVANTIFSQEFISILPLWISIVMSALLVIGYWAAYKLFTPARGILVGLGLNILVFVFSVLLFRLTRRYLPTLTPQLSVAVTFVTRTIISFLATAKEKNFIRNAFGQYLSNDVINDLLAHPDKLTLGGEKKVLTAMFTDVKGFSTISETMDPTDLVKLLNRYLTEMSDIVMDHRGTIDKFEGDAIIAFFGAPTSFDDHPEKACMAAIKMKRAEALLNVKVKEENLSPYPLNTRIGINTGDMVVGNMGTARKMDYTIMGNAVNLAARLEGVNKRYGIWILMSDATWEAGGKNFATRRLDRVRVVGINTPVRLYELVEEQAQLPDDKRKVLQIFDQGLTLSEERQWDQAIQAFQEALAIDPADGPAKYYLERCQNFVKQPPQDSWDGVFNLTEK